MVVPALCLLFSSLFLSLLVVLTLSLSHTHTHTLASSNLTLFSPSLCLSDDKSYVLLFIMVRRLVGYITCDVCYMFFNKLFLLIWAFIKFWRQIFFFFSTFAFPFNLLPFSLRNLNIVVIIIFDFQVVHKHLQLLPYFQIQSVKFISKLINSIVQKLLVANVTFFFISNLLPCSIFSSKTNTKSFHQLTSSFLLLLLFWLNAKLPTVSLFFFSLLFFIYLFYYYHIIITILWLLVYL